MADEEMEEETGRGRDVYRWLYAGLAALVLILGGTVLYRMEAVARLLGVAKEPGASQQADKTTVAAREDFLKTTSEFGKDGVTLASLVNPDRRGRRFARRWKPKCPTRRTASRSGADVRSSSIPGRMPPITSAIR